MASSTERLLLFLRALRESPDLAAEFTKMVGWLNVMAATPGLTEGVATEMKAFLQMLHRVAPFRWKVLLPHGRRVATIIARRGAPAQWPCPLPHAIGSGVPAMRHAQRQSKS